MEIVTHRCKNGALFCLYCGWNSRPPPSRASSLGISIFFFSKILRNQRKMDRPPLFIAAIYTFFDATRYLGKMKKKLKKSINLSKILASFSSKYIMNLFKNTFLKKCTKNVFLIFQLIYEYYQLMFIVQFLFCCATLANASCQYIGKSPYKKVKWFPSISKTWKTWNSIIFCPGESKKAPFCAISYVSRFPRFVQTCNFGLFYFR